jgi:two-component system OmpR family response regulator
LVEDEAKVRRSLQKGLEEEGYEVIAVDNGNDGLHQATTQQFDCLVLDLMLPGLNGLEILQKMRAAGRQTPTIILTARGAIDDRVRGLDAGADDYLPKPFAFAELLARIRACLRRGAAQTETVLRAGDLSLDCIHRRVVQADKEIDLTAREFELLEYLMKHRGEVVTREMIARDVWREPPGAMTNVIDVYINYVRKKLERAGNPRLIHTIRGIGYRFGGDE